MRPARFVVAAIALASILVAAPVSAAERAIPYADMHEAFKRIELMKGGNYIKAEAKLDSADPAVPTAQATLVIKSKGGDIPVPIDADGHLEFPLNDALLAENPPVMTNVAAKKLSVSVNMRVEAPLVSRFKYALLTAVLDEADALVAKQGVMARMFAPDFEGLVISFAVGTKASATVESAGGPVKFEADADGRVHIPDKRAWRKQDPFIQLSATPTDISLDIEQ